MKGSDLIKILDAHRERLVRNEEEEVGGFALVVPPHGPIVDVLIFGSTEDQKTFYTGLKDRIAHALERSQQYGGVETDRWG
jgi:hypothetical protein